MPTTGSTSPSPANSVSLPSGLNDIPADTPWEIALLKLTGSPTTSANIAFLNGWFIREHGHELGTMYANNPFFTTAGGGYSAGKFTAGMYPTIQGVNGNTISIFPDVATGLVATVATMQSYPNILAALQSGNPQGYANGPNGGNFSRELLHWSGSGYGGFANGPSIPYGPNLGRDVPEGIIAGGNKGLGAGFTSSIEGSVGGAVSGVTGAVGGAVSATEAIGKFLGKLGDPNTWLRIGEVVAGGLLVGLALYLIAKDLGLPVPGSLPGAAGKAADSSADLAAAFEKGQEQGAVAAARAAGRAEARRTTAYAPSTATESRASVRRRELREKAARIPDDDIPF